MILAISGSALLSAIIYLLIIGLIVWVIWWALSQFTIPEPFNKVVRVLLVLITALIVVNVLLGLIGHPLVTW